MSKPSDCCWPDSLCIAKPARLDRVNFAGANLSRFNLSRLNLARFNLSRLNLVHLGMVHLGMALIHAGLALFPATGLSEEKSVSPRIAMCVPLGVPVWATSKVIVRGWGLEQASEVQVEPGGVSVKLLSKSAAPVPGRQDAVEVGNTQVEVEVTVDADAAIGQRVLTLVTPSGTTSAHRLLIGAAEGELVREAEANDGFRGAQALGVPQCVEGQIQGDRDVDVFSLVLPQPASLIVDLLARRQGSCLDSLLTLYNERGGIVTSNDDQADTTDSRLEVALPAGRYYLAVQDAHDRGGPAHPYRLMVKRAD